MENITQKINEVGNLTDVKLEKTRIYNIFTK
jgi:hypothetical protein